MSSVPATMETGNADHRSRADARHDVWFRRLLKTGALLVLAALLGLLAVSRRRAR